eukprot:620597-Prorocentrum_minimum.AAC.5
MGLFFSRIMALFGEREVSRNFERVRGRERERHKDAQFESSRFLLEACKTILGYVKTIEIRGSIVVKFYPSKLHSQVWAQSQHVLAWHLRFRSFARQARILVLGLDNAGKTTILCILSLDFLHSPIVLFYFSLLIRVLNYNYCLLDANGRMNGEAIPSGLFHMA